MLADEWVDAGMWKKTCRDNIQLSDADFSWLNRAWSKPGHLKVAFWDKVSLYSFCSDSKYFLSDTPIRESDSSKLDSWHNYQLFLPMCLRSSTMMQ